MISNKKSYQLNVGCIHENCAQVHYQGEPDYDLERDLESIFATHGYKVWASGYGAEVRDIGYEKNNR